MYNKRSIKCFNWEDFIMPDNNYYDHDPVIYSLTDEDGKQWEFELLDELDIADEHYYAFTLAAQSKEESVSMDRPLVIMRTVENEQTGAEEMEMVPEDEFERIGSIFMERLGAMEEDLYDDDFDYDV